MLKGVLQRTLLLAMALVFSLAALEVVTRLGIRVTRGHGFLADDVRTAMSAQAHVAAPRATQAGPGEYSVGIHEVIHPYLGFIPDPAALPNELALGDAGQIPPPSDHHLNVGLFGGSFAAGVCHWAAAELRRVLAQPGKEVRLFCLTAGGYKQPQQLLALAYLLAQGAHFDLVINVDGFNEVALPPDNRSQGVAPIYPRSWFWRVGNIPDPSALKLLGELSTLEHDRQSWAGTFLAWHFERSALLSSVWQRFDQTFAARRNALLAEIQVYRVEQHKSYASTGPTTTFPDEQSFYTYLASVWRDSSVQMQSLCAANHIEYAHFLQPNQHVVGSKPMGAEEQRLAGRTSTYHTAVVIGYPILRQQEAALRAAGVPFHDLTMIFADVSEPLYSDGCCHLRPQGYVMVARRIGEILHADTEAQEPAS